MEMGEFAEERTSIACPSDVRPPGHDETECKIHDDLRRKWQQKQDELKSNLQTEDCHVMKAIMESIDNTDLSDRPFYIGGVDISFVKGDNVNACAALVVVSFPDLKVVYEDYQMVKLTAPYIAGFLAFREADFLVELVNTLRETQPEYLPHVIMVDGNGRLHVRGFGLACHLGVLLDLPCIGVAKTLYQVDGLEKNAEHTAMMKEHLKKGGDSVLLVGQSGIAYGKALRSHDSSTNPIYISQGHKVSLDSSVKLVYSCCQYRIPEPVRKADINSREYLRVNFPTPPPEHNTEDNEPTNGQEAGPLDEKTVQPAAEQKSE